MAGLSKENQLRDVFNPRTITLLANDIKRVWPKFDKDGFLASILPKLVDLGFGQRSALICDALAEFLPKDFSKAIGILVNSLGPELNATEIAAWDSFTVMSQCAFVSKYGKGHFDISINALHEMTKRFSAEWDLRTFIDLDFERAMKILRKWCDDPNPHVRRLVSEGTRARLPLASRIRRFQKNPRPLISLLDILKSDPSDYVRRSVANNINDIAKDNADIAISTLKRWNKESNPQVRWVVRHAARSLIKQGHPAAITMLGYSLDPQITVSTISIRPEMQKRGDAVEFIFSIKSKAISSQKLIVDYAIHYQKANGKLLPKVFKLRNLVLHARGKVDIAKKVCLKNTSGRTIYPGCHAIEIRVNGKPCAKKMFTIY